MTAKRLQLEIFDIPSAKADSIELSPAAFETAKLESYETGYAAGWDDCAKNNADQATAARTALSQSLQDIGFTCTEARTQLMASVTAFISAITEIALPKMLHDTLGARLQEILADFANRTLQEQVILRACSALKPLLEEALLTQPTLRASIQEDDNLAPGTIQLTCGDGGVVLDTDLLISQIRDAVLQFNQQRSIEANHD